MTEDEALVMVLESSLRSQTPMKPDHALDLLQRIAQKSGKGTDLDDRAHSYTRWIKITKYVHKSLAEAILAMAREVGLS